MRAGKIFRLVTLNLCIALVNIIVFGACHVGFDLSNPLGAAFGAVVILLSAVAFFSGNTKILFKSSAPVKPVEINSLGECAELLEQNRRKKTFSADIATLEEQITRFQKKKQTIDEILLQKFSSSEMSYSKFQGVITDVENVLFLNIKSVLNRLSAFDQDEYDRISGSSGRRTMSETLYQSKMSIFNEYISFVKDAVEGNENILLKLDKMLLEISKYNSLEDGELENMSAMKEIDELIKDAKLFK